MDTALKLLNIDHQFLISSLGALPLKLIALFSCSVVFFSPTIGWSQQGVSCDLQAEVKKLRLAVGNLHLKHKSLAAEFQGNRDTDTKNKADLKGLKGI